LAGAGLVPEQTSKVPQDGARETAAATADDSFTVDSGASTGIKAAANQR